MPYVNNLEDKFGLRPEEKILSIDDLDLCHQGNNTDLERSL